MRFNFSLITCFIISLCYSQRIDNIRTESNYYEVINDEDFIKVSDLDSKNTLIRQLPLQSATAVKPELNKKLSTEKRIVRQDLPESNSDVLPEVKSVRNKPKAESLDSKELPGWLLFGSEAPQEIEDNVEYEGYNGWYNNIGHPSLGAVDTPLIRLVFPKYSDGVYKPSGEDRPNPILLSETFMRGEIGNKSNTGKTAFFVFFGQQVVEEILDAQGSGCPPEYISIKLPKHVLAQNGSVVEYIHNTGHTSMPLLRTRYYVKTGQSPNNPRQQLNEITPWIDGGLVYGTSKGWSNTLRSFEGGSLLSFTEKGEFPIYNDIRLPLTNPPPPSGPNEWFGNSKPEPKPRLLPSKRFFRLGNPRGHENPFLLTMGVIWFRWHNRLAQELLSTYPEWSDERIYNMARKWVIASHQQIVINEWLPILLGYQLPEYKGYDPSIDPQISHIFQSAAFRFGHTLVTAGGIKRNGNCSSVDKLDGHSFNPHIIRTCNSFWKPINHLLKGGFEEIIMGLSSQPAEAEDNVVVEDLRGSVFGPLEFTRRDLMAINIQRGRDHGLPDYLTARRELGLDDEDMSGKSIEEIAKKLWKYNLNRDPILLEKAKMIYKNRTDKIDIWVGGLLETSGYQPGPLFRFVISDQFRRIRDGDRFWFENSKNGLFTNEEISRLKELTIYDIIRSITSIKINEIQPKLFRLPTEESNPISSECTKAMSKSYSYECVTDIEKGTKEKCLSLGAVTRNRVLSDNCTKAHTYDYFEGSEFSYALTFFGIGIFGLICIATLRCLANRRLALNERLRKSNSNKKRMTLNEEITLAQEWINRKEGLRGVQIHCKSSKKCIIVKLENGGKAVRSIDLREVIAIELQASANRSQDYLCIKVAKEYDLVLKFDSYYDRERFTSKIELFLEEIGVGRERVELDLKTILKNAYTKEKRQKHLEQFFRVVFSHAFGVNTKEQLNVKTAKQVINTELTQFEFADALSMRPDSTFVQQMFALVDKDKNGYISFREFLDMIIIFAKGSADQKAKLMFDMYDVNRTGKLTVDDFKTMIKSMLELANQSISAQQMDEVIESMFRTAGLRSRQELTFSNFQKLLGDYKEELGYAELNFDVSVAQEITSSAGNRRQSALLRANDTLIRAYSYFGGPSDPKRMPKDGKPKTTPSLLRVVTQEEKRGPEWLTVWKRIADEYKLQIFWITIYSAIIAYIFVDKAYTYTYLREHGGLRQIAGLGVTLTRGAASVQMFCYSTILLTMCRNIITFLRETFLHRFVPFDGVIGLHKYIAFWALIMSIIHSVGHAINFYHISTQTADDTKCLFREFYHSSDELPKFFYWCWQTITGITGVLLLCLVILMYVFAIQYSRRNIFNAFWATHNLYPLLYILMVLHGLGRIVQPPIFYHYFTIPIVLFTIDRLISVSRKKVEISVIRATLHPSDVTHLEFKRPPGFDYKSGQWVRIACLALSTSEYHPFTLASAPHEDNLSLFIRAVGPFTKNLRQTYDPNNLGFHAYPKLYLDGPYGEGHQDWLKFDVSVLVGGGIGVTPFASILKDIAFRATVNTKINCKKVYFLWVTRTQKHFEWLSDVIRDTEEKDVANLLTTHIFITQFYEKFDLRTTMLYICERHFQRISNKSLFTGLKAKTHFGRPNFTVFLDSLQQEHPNVTRVGVFSCGPGPMTTSVQQSCETLNRREGAIFSHHFENF